MLKSQLTDYMGMGVPEFGKSSYFNICMLRDLKNKDKFKTENEFRFTDLLIYGLADLQTHRFTYSQTQTYLTKSQQKSSAIEHKIGKSTFFYKI